MELLVLWLAALVVSLVFSQPKPPAVIYIAVITGGIAGLLQSRAVVGTAQDWVAANTALQLRRVLRSTPSGKYSIYLLWLFACALVLLAFNGRPESTLVTLVAGYSAFAFVRDAVVLPALLKLAPS